LAGAMFWHRLTKCLREWRRRARTRRDSACLDNRRLHDLGRDPGMNPAQLQFEAQKPFWRD
jgi:uncharacterized protein YjiS (DUF1127 family)